MMLFLNDNLEYLNLLLRTIKIVLNFLLFFGIIIIIMILIKLIYHYIKYGYIGFGVFSVKGNVAFKKDLLLLMIDKVPGYRKIINTKEYKSDMIMFDQSGIYLFKIFDKEGLVSGKYNNKNLILKNGKDNEELIENPYLGLKEDGKKVASKYDGVKIKKYIVISNMCVFDFKDSVDVFLISLGKFATEMKKATKSKKYTKEEVKKFYKEFR